MEERTVHRHLAGAELWARSAGEPGRGDEPVFVAGWEDGEAFCATVCSTDKGLRFCRRCPTETARRALATGRAARGRCGAGGRLLGFPAPRGSRTTVAVLRVGPPTPRAAAAAAEATRVAPDALRRAARNAPPANGGAALEAARALRDPVRLLEWAVSQRARGSDRRRKATAALAQMIATSEEFLELFRASERQRSELARNQRRLDRLARETLRASDLERARIGHQIHDTAAQSMVSAFRFLEAARASAHAAVASASSDGPAGSASPGSPVAAGAASAAVDEYLATASERLQTAIQEVRAVLARLLPPGLEELGLAHALRRRTAELAAESGLAVEVEGSLPRLEAWVEQALYGMTVEAAGNAVRHGKAQTVRVELAERRGRAVVTVRDDGQGFDPARTDRRGGHGVGLVGLSRQATWLGGRTTIRSQPGSGTVVRISIPLASHLAGGPTEGRADHRERPARPAARVPRPSPVRPSDGRSPELEPMLEPR